MVLSVEKNSTFEKISISLFFVESIFVISSLKKESNQF